MNHFVFHLPTLILHMYCRFISMLTRHIYIKAFRQKFTSLKLFLHFWMQPEYFFRCNTFYHLKYFRRTLQEKQNDKVRQ